MSVGGKGTLRDRGRRLLDAWLSIFPGPTSTFDRRIVSTYSRRSSGVFGNEASADPSGPARCVCQSFAPVMTADRRLAANVHPTLSEEVVRKLCNPDRMRGEGKRISGRGGVAGLGARISSLACAVRLTEGRREAAEATRAGEPSTCLFIRATGAGTHGDAGTEA